MAVTREGDGGSALCINTKGGERKRRVAGIGALATHRCSLVFPCCQLYFSSLFFLSDSFNQHNKARPDFHYGVLAARDGRRVSSERRIEETGTGGCMTRWEYSIDGGREKLTAGDGQAEG